MDMMEKLKQIYEQYYETAEKVRKQAPRFAGFWGMGDDPRRHHCHDVFYEEVGAWVSEYLNTHPYSWEVAAAAKYILEAADLNRDKEAFWYTFAAQSHVAQMILWMNPSECRELADWYDTKYTKIERLPAQKDLYKKLRKAAKS